MYVPGDTFGSGSDPYAVSAHTRGHGRSVGGLQISDLSAYGYRVRIPVCGQDAHGRLDNGQGKKEEVKIESVERAEQS